MQSSNKSLHWQTAFWKKHLVISRDLRHESGISTWPLEHSNKGSINIIMQQTQPLLWDETLKTHCCLIVVFPHKKFSIKNPFEVILSSSQRHQGIFFNCASEWRQGLGLCCLLGRRDFSWIRALGLVQMSNLKSTSSVCTSANWHNTLLA